jgi:hypothetical protein
MEGRELMERQSERLNDYPEAKAKGRRPSSGDQPGIEAAGAVPAGVCIEQIVVHSSASQELSAGPVEARISTEGRTFGGSSCVRR